MELNETKAIAGVPSLGLTICIIIFTDAHPMLSIIIKLENYKI